MEGLSWLPGETWRRAEGGIAREEGLLSEMLCKMLVCSLHEKLGFFVLNSR